MTRMQVIKGWTEAMQMMKVSPVDLNESISKIRHRQFEVHKLLSGTDDRLMHRQSPFRLSLGAQRRSDLSAVRAQVGGLPNRKE